MPRAIVTLTTDFGLSDSYVAEMKAAILRQSPSVRLIDVTHQVPPHDILCGSITLERAVDGFPPGTVHLAVVDPGVGTDRRILIARINQQWVVCPDNGLITWTWRLHQPAEAHALVWKPKSMSATFHGRDVMAPVAGMLANGRAVEEIAKPMTDPVLLEVAPSVQSSTGRIIRVDHFGNATTNIAYEPAVQRKTVAVRVKGKPIGKLKRTYWDVAPGKVRALIGSSGLLEIAVRDGSAARELKLRVGDKVEVQ